MKLLDIITEAPNMLTEASDLYCPNCDENLGKDTQLRKKASCGNCGEKNIDNPRGDDDS